MKDKLTNEKHDDGLKLDEILKYLSGFSILLP
jgi:hypothetical protein